MTHKSKRKCGLMRSRHHARAPPPAGGAAAGPLSAAAPCRWPRPSAAASPPCAPARHPPPADEGSITIRMLPVRGSVVGHPSQGSDSICVNICGLDRVSFLPTFCLSLGANASGERCCMNSKAGSAMRRLTQSPVASGTRNMNAAVRNMSRVLGRTLLQLVSAQEPTLFGHANYPAHLQS
jgi:hypothetical protein